MKSGAKTPRRGRQTVNVHEAKTRLSQLLAAVEDGEEVVIARAGRPIAKLVRLGTSPRRGFGDLRGRVWISDDFDAPLPAEVEGAFYD